MPVNCKAALERAIRAYPGKVGLAVRTLEGREFLHHASTAWQPASVIKLVVLCAAFHTLDWEKRCRLPKLAHGGGWGVLQHLRLPLELTLGDIVFLMIFISDNAATDYLLSRIPPAFIPTMLRKLGLKNTRLKKGFGTAYEPSRYARDQNVTTPMDILLLLEHIRSHKELKQMLAQQMDQAILHRALPSDVRRFTKSGQFEKARNDVGILEWDGGGCIISLFSVPAKPIRHGALDHLAELDGHLAQIAKRAYEWARFGSDASRSR